jgi:hypothetical protein
MSDMGKYLAELLDQIPDNCCCHMDSDNHCWLAPAYTHRSDVKINESSSFTKRMR